MNFLVSWAEELRNRFRSPLAVFSLSGGISFTITAISWLTLSEPNGIVTSDIADYEELSIEHNSRILKTTSLPKLVIVSGSNAAYGISAEMMTRKLGIPPVNFGLNAGFGPHFLFWLVKPHLKPNDTVLLPLEFSIYDYNAYRINQSLEHVVVGYYWKYLSELPASIRLKFRFSIRLKLIWKLLLTQYSIHRKDLLGFPKPMLNAFGDRLENRVDRIEPNLLENIRLEGPNDILMNGFSKRRFGWRTIAAFLDWCKQREIRVLATFPTAMRFPEYKDREKRITRIEQRISAFYRERNIPIIGNLKEALLDPALIFDTEYHPNSAGTLHRTNRLIELIRPHLDSDPDR